MFAGPSLNSTNTTNNDNIVTPINSVTVPALLDNQILLSEEFPDDIGVTNFRHLGGVGECRHDFHCIGSESCVNYKGNFM